jgi:NADPH:quinone reductase-like Zn-dependent oxidoreductase
MRTDDAPLALWYEAEGAIGQRPAPLAARGEGELLVRGLYSGVSRGTERLVLQGRVPEGEVQRMRCPFQHGDFPFPVKYGYQAVGVVEDGPAGWLGRTVFALHPHQTRFVVPAGAVMPLPDAVPARRATLAGNMETALNALWDGGAGPGDRITVVGAGLVGLLTAAIAARLPGARVTVVDREPSRARPAAMLGAAFRAPGEVEPEADIVFHASASEAGLATAIAAAGFEARIVEMSWYGAGSVAVALGGAFHSQRLSLVSSQVGTVARGRRARWDRRRRLAAALGLLDDARLDALITHEIAFDDAPAHLPSLLAENPGTLGIVLRYPPQ